MLCFMNFDNIINNMIYSSPPRVSRIVTLKKIFGKILEVFLIIHSGNFYLHESENSFIIIEWNKIILNIHCSDYCI